MKNKKTKDDEIIILMNPSSGMNRSLDNKGRLENLLQEYKIPYRLFLSQSEQHLRQLARKHYQSKIVCAAGGDSSITIVLDELLRKNFSGFFAMIGLGSSDDLMRDLNINTLEKAVKALSIKNHKPIDVMQISDEKKRHVTFALGQVNLGLGAFVNQYVEDLKRQKVAFAKNQTLVGLWAIARTIRKKLVPLNLQIQAFDKKKLLAEFHGDFTIAIISKIRFWASGLVFIPQAKNDDQKLHLVLEKKVSFLRQLKIAYLSKTAEHLTQKEIHTQSATSFVVSSQQPFMLQVDGDIIGKETGGRLYPKISITIAKKSLKMIC